MTTKKITTFIIACFLSISTFTPKANALSFAEFIYQNAKINNLNTIKTFLQRGYYIDATDTSGMTALCYAIELKDFEAYKRIKALGANSNHPCTQRTTEETTKHYAKRVEPVEQERIQKQASSSSSINKAYLGTGILATAGAVALLSGGGGGGGSNNTSTPPSTEEDDDDHITCPEGYGAIDGKCYPISAPTECRQGEQLINGVCEKIECPEGFHAVGTTCLPNDGHSENLEFINGSYVSSGNQNINNQDNSDVFGIYSNGTELYNLYSAFARPDDYQEINIENLGHGQVIGVYSEGHATNAFVDGQRNEGEINPISNASGKIKIRNYGDGAVYGIYSRILDAQNSWEAANAYSADKGIARGSINIENYGSGKTVGIWGDDRAYNAISLTLGKSYGDITLKGKGDIIGIGGYMGVMNGTSHQWYVGKETIANINIDSSGDGNIYGIKIQKDIKDVESNAQQWFAINASAAAGEYVEGNINIKNQGDGNVYGMYGGQQLFNGLFYGATNEQGLPTSVIRGNINIENHGSGHTYGMYLPEADANGIIANIDLDGYDDPELGRTGVKSTINIINIGDGVATGMRGGQFNRIQNTGTININNLGSGTAIGIYGERNSNIENSGTINIYRQAYKDSNNQTYTPSSKVGGTAYGIYAETKSHVVNNGSINISNAASGKGIYLENGATLENNGTINFNGQEQIASTGAAIDVYGTTSPSNVVDFNSMGEGEVVLGKTGRFFGDTLKGDLNVSNSAVKGSFEDTYTISSALHSDNINELNLKSKSAMFSTQTQQNEDTGADVVLTRKDFKDIISNQSLANYLEKNYQAQKNLSLFDYLKTAETTKELAYNANNVTANDILPTFRKQNAIVQRAISQTLDDNLFNAPNQNYIAGYKYIDISNNPDNAIQESEGTAHTAYGMLKNKTSSGLTYGIGANITKLKSSYDNNSERTANQLGLWMPLGYDFNNGVKWYSKLSATYSDTSYDRNTDFGTKKGSYDEYQINLDNEIRYTIDLSKDFSLTPLLELNYTQYFSDKIDEGSSNQALKVDSSNTNSLELGLGALINKDFKISPDQNLNIKIGGIYYVELLSPDKTLKGQLVDGIEKIDIYNKQDKNRATLTLKANYNYKDLTLYGNIEKELNNDKSLLIDAGIQYNL